MSTNENFHVSDQAIIDAILEYTRNGKEPAVVKYDPDGPEAERMSQEHRIVTWFQDIRTIVDAVCQRPGFSGLNVLKIATRAMEQDIIAQSAGPASPINPEL
ncbi:hypothetical protein RAY_96 [Erwinia phage vB_EamM_RAY]|jgi:hypothetical protein|uniref:Uncharacterized protein n=10 Tax=Agricanvirus TaxID=1984776 RepID=A0A173GE16_9CAUD|nr:hypothetical protein Ea357_096 [Erwinia phage Ea35-70]YP_009605244.1 hypothetical protein FDH97_gp101 [Erwinia phage vB_EamM_Deimos-Minion]YP_009605563.1 hypothetical protein FDH98_gp096 [Erwinia phage vB_EamM_RAY]YP_009605883.1 hypothetical protein FDH99_gp099 [Erwinia phage vB_EamM_Simmy50]YP_009606205.1 hypothetical protein FDI00_gp099 [Erwinia phage vB_EamM_Special G]YP_009621837.1 hypothetical protein FDJ23_gp096 [Erwinia phage vB_EamM_Desertfox]AUG85884.1 hypothetical protein BOSOLAP